MDPEANADVQAPVEAPVEETTPETPAEAAPETVEAEPTATEEGDVDAGGGPSSAGE